MNEFNIFRTKFIAYILVFSLISCSFPLCAMESTDEIWEYNNGTSYLRYKHSCTCDGLSGWEIYGYPALIGFTSAIAGVVVEKILDLGSHLKNICWSCCKKNKKKDKDKKQQNSKSSSDSNADRGGLRDSRVSTREHDSSSSLTNRRTRTGTPKTLERRRVIDTSYSSNFSSDDEEAQKNNVRNKDKTNKPIGHSKFLLTEEQGSKSSLADVDVDYSSDEKNKKTEKSQKTKKLISKKPKPQEAVTEKQKISKTTDNKEEEEETDSISKKTIEISIIEKKKEEKTTDKEEGEEETDSISKKTSVTSIIEKQKEEKTSADDPSDKKNK